MVENAKKIVKPDDANATVIVDCPSESQSFRGTSLHILSAIYLDQWKYSIAGAAAGCTSALITCPLDVVKTRLQNQGLVPMGTQKPYRGTFNTLKRIYMEEGVRGSFRGLAPTLLGYLPSWAIYFSVYNRFKGILMDTLHTSHNSPLVYTLSAMIAGATSTISTNPLWVVKTRLMTQNAQSNYYYHNTWHALYMLFRVEGIRGFYRGLTPSLFGILHVAVQFPLYERFKHIMMEDTCGKKNWGYFIIFNTHKSPIFQN
jgi:solute carrier family 25 (mitochondrial folate transporter), member 32